MYLLLKTIYSECLNLEDKDVGITRSLFVNFNEEYLLYIFKFFLDLICIKIPKEKEKKV